MKKIRDKYLLGNKVKRLRPFNETYREKNVAVLETDTRIFCVECMLESFLLYEVVAIKVYLGSKSSYTQSKHLRGKWTCFPKSL